MEILIDLALHARRAPPEYGFGVLLAIASGWAGSFWYERVHQSLQPPEHPSPSATSPGPQAEQNHGHSHEPR
jgi:hypothetical protein